MVRQRFVMVGGFLGAGKTTTITRLAAMYRDRGHRVAIVTNDQADDLVDTQSIAARGFAVAEVPGACFCCKFDSLVDAMKELSERERPDVILAEPVGSCTDLVATVVQALRRLMPGLEVAPFAVVLKASLARLALLGESPDQSSKIGYIFRKQLEEADAIVINRADTLGPAQLASLATLIAECYPTTPILTASAKTGQGFDSLLEFLAQPGDFGGRILDIDYDVYADAEAELGWLNTTVRMVAPSPFEVDARGDASSAMGTIERLRAILLLVAEVRSKA
jgi:G3E family GTPase